MPGNSASTSVTQFPSTSVIAFLTVDMAHVAGRAVEKAMRGRERSESVARRETRSIHTRSDTDEMRSRLDIKKNGVIS